VAIFLTIPSPVRCARRQQGRSATLATFARQFDFENPPSESAALASSIEFPLLLSSFRFFPLRLGCLKTLFLVNAPA